MANPESSVQAVISNDDLLTEILVRLPALSLVLFKSVSKHWFSVIKEANLTFRPNLDPVSGLFIYTSYKKDGFERSYNYYYFVALDIRIPAPATNITFGQDVHGDFEILHACNGLLLCDTYSGKLIVYNPSITNMFKVIPKPDNVTHYQYTIYGGLRMAFDPTKSPHYKVIYVELVDGDLDKWVQIHTFSSKTGNWSLCGPHSPLSFFFFRSGVYWNDAICWINDEFHGGDFFKLDIMNGHPVLTASQIPLTVYRNVDYERRLFESGGCLLLVGKNGPHSGHYTIYEKRNEYSQWSMKYIVNLDDIIKPFPTRWSIWSNVFCIVSEEKEDSFLVMKLDRKVVQYKILSKTLSTISDFGPNGNIVSCFPFIPSFANA